MTRKDFQLIADVIKGQLSQTLSGHEIARLRALANDMANALATTNPNFDRDKFLAACGAQA